ncbi:hypothetical protein LXL04_016950 [Taraxacum kok-saghyz]
MKRKRAPKKEIPKMPLAKKRLQLQKTDALMAENHVINDEIQEPENITSVHMEIEDSRTRQVLSEIIKRVIKEISKESGGLNSLTKSLIDSSINNGEMKQPNADVDIEENERKHHQNQEYKQEELNAALTVIKKTMKLDASDPFNRPVDPVELGIPDYFDVIKTPMDFGTICNNIENGLKYMNSADVFKDVEYIWCNCVKYNKKGDVILDLMKRVKTYFMRNWKAAGLQTEQSVSLSPRIVDTILREKDHSLSPPANNLTQKEAGPIQVAESNPTPINIQAGQSQSQSQSQTPQSCNLPQSSSEQDDDHDPDFYTPDSKSIQKKPQSCGGTVGVEISKRIKIMTNELGQPVGPEACKLTSFLGVIARDGKLAPLTYATWIKMPQEYKENMWQKVLARYDVDPSCRKWVLMSLRTKWRNFKSHLKTTHYDVHDTDEKRLQDCDVRVLPDQWATLVSLWSTEKWQNICATNKANRAKLKFNHTTGKKSFARLREEERAKRPDGQEPSQAELFILTRTRKNGQPVNEATAAVISQLCESTTRNEEETRININNNKHEDDDDDNDDDDVYNRVMEHDKKSGVCGTPSLPTRIEAIKMVEKKNSEVVEMKEKLSSMEQTCSQMAAQMSQMVALMATMQKQENIPEKKVDLFYSWKEEEKVNK